jgi:hypothetical protein
MVEAAVAADTGPEAGPDGRGRVCHAQADRLGVRGWMGVRFRVTLKLLT